jgi:hypothetical protein
MIFLPFLCTYLQSTCLHHGLILFVTRDEAGFISFIYKNIPIWLDYNRENKARLLR